LFLFGFVYYLSNVCLCLYLVVGGARLFSLENARAIAVYKSPVSQPGERDNTGREVSRGSMARGRTVAGVAFSLSDVKAIAVARGVMDCCGAVSSRVGGQQS
jgi:hypothetical protein